MLLWLPANTCKQHISTLLSTASAAVSAVYAVLARMKQIIVLQHFLYLIRDFLGTSVDLKCEFGTSIYDDQLKGVHDLTNFSHTLWAD